MNTVNLKDALVEIVLIIGRGGGGSAFSGSYDLLGGG